jgi:hypothetical protein
MFNIELFGPSCPYCCASCDFNRYNQQHPRKRLFPDSPVKAKPESFCERRQLLLSDPFNTTCSDYSLGQEEVMSLAGIKPEGEPVKVVSEKNKFRIVLLSEAPVEPENSQQNRRDGSGIYLVYKSIGFALSGFLLIAVLKMSGHLL